MNDETIAALRGSIEHHERMRDGKGGMLGRSGCDLCRRFDWKCRARDGAVCPVDEATSNGCDGTPYQELWNHVERHHFGGTAIRPIPTCAECVRLENAEIEFLRSLRPIPTCAECVRLENAEIEFLRSLLPEGVKS